VKVATLSAILGVVLILIILWDAFETIVLPRQVTGRIRLARFFFRYTWLPWSALVRSMFSGKRKEAYLSFYGPLSLIFLLMVWATGLIVGFALLHWANGSAVITAGGGAGFRIDLYLSSTTFFTLGLGDVTPRTPMGHVLTAMEAGIGFGFLALVIGYLPAFNQSFSRREVNISLLDGRAGSPPTAAEMLIRHSHEHGFEALRELLGGWERWSAELLESHLSYPMLCFFRSQHDNQSWLGALTVILDTSALVIAGVEGACQRQAELTFAIARHAVVDLSIILRQAPREPEHDRLPLIQLEYLRKTLAAKSLTLREGSDADGKLIELRQMYEPYVYSLSNFLGITLPGWIRETTPTDNWQTSAWGSDPGLQKEELPKVKRVGHF
jgi:hypothetical protein